MNISIAIATYNGEKYIREQLDSVLKQISESDEIIVSDDNSTDQTWNVLQEYVIKYPQIKLLKGPQKGFCKNFENAFLNCKNDIIFICDQDDIWKENKINIVKRIFELEPQINIVAHKRELFYKEIGDGSIRGNYKKGVFKNIILSSYCGCCMAVRRDYLRKFLPFGIQIIAYDQLLGLFGEKDRSSYYIDDALIYHRIHGNNVSRKLSLVGKICFRFKMLNDYIRCYKK